MIRYVFDSDEDSREMRALLGGKRANLAEMTRVLGASRVSGGFTVNAEACVEYMRSRASCRRDREGG